MSNRCDPSKKEPNSHFQQSFLPNIANLQSINDMFQRHKFQLSCNLKKNHNVHNKLHKESEGPKNHKVIGLQIQELSCIEVSIVQVSIYMH